MNCRRFRDLLFQFQADELAEIERRDCQVHLDRCPGCAELLEAENGLLRVLRSKLSATPAPPGLETRVRASLRASAPAPRAALPWYRASWLAASAAALLLLAVLVPGLGGGLDLRPSGTLHVDEHVTVVDRDCDEAGHPLSGQRKCTHPLHVNALKLANGQYWTVSADQKQYRYLLLNRDQRGHRFHVEGEYHLDLHTVRIERLEPVEQGSL